MSEETDRIEADLQGKRDALRANLDELEDRVKSVTDWRRQFERHPGAMMAAAIGAGAVLAAVVGRRQGTRRRASPAGELGESAPQSPSGAAPRGGVVTRQVWDPIRDALIGVAVMRASGFLEDMLPGFAEQLKRGRTAKGGSSRSFGDQAGSQPLQGEGPFPAPRRHRGGGEEFLKTADIGRSADGGGLADQHATAEVGGSGQTAPKRAKPV